MYCIKCGVKLADSEKVCPLCGTKVYNPDIEMKQDVYTYPEKSYPKRERRSLGSPVFLTALMLIPVIVTLACDLRFNLAVTWSGFVVSALLAAYVMFVLPLWFRDPNPVIFVPCSFAAAGLLLLYICLKTGGSWFLPLALPCVLFFGITVTAVVTLLRYVKKGKLYIFGGATIAVGLFMLLLEYLIKITFGLGEMIGWSFIPMSALVLIGGFLIFLAICRPAREVVERKMFI